MPDEELAKLLYESERLRLVTEELRAEARRLIAKSHEIKMEIARANCAESSG
jgi:hypothetical protein